ncbi:hypothetical protein AGMMS50262_18250 [Bacteroidia bacterium]|nr:hypothetical protein AGMMS50262_18250 [Bacteroidia bacterium]
MPTSFKETDIMTALSNEHIINVLNLFQKQIKEKKMNEQELADALDTKMKLYNEIFGIFDNQLNTTYKNNLAGVIFDRIVFASEQIQNSDIDTIQKFRNNKQYEDCDRTLIVSGLTISLLNHFDAKKLHLLIDFVTDFEEGVWQKALVGLLFTLTRYNNKLGLFPEIGKRLNELKEIADIQNSIYIIDRVLRFGSYSAKETYKRNPNRVIDILKVYMGNSIDLTREELIEIQNDLNTSSCNTDIESKMINSILNKDKIDELLSKLGDAESISMSINDFVEVLDLDTYLELYELNPFRFNLKDDFFKSSRNWFMPFKDNENIRNILVNDCNVEDIDIVDFISVLQKSSISDIDKHCFLIHIKDYSDDFICMLYAILSIDILDSQNKYMSILEKNITMFVRDLYRFSKSYEIDNKNNMFDKKLSIYGQSLLEKIANNITKIKINSQYLYDNENYKESLESLQNIPKNKYDFDIFELFANNYIALEQYEDAIPYLDKVILLIENGENIVNDTIKAAWYRKAKNLYSNLEDKAPDEYRNTYRAYLDKETTVR